MQRKKIIQKIKRLTVRTDTKKKGKNPQIEWIRSQWSTCKKIKVYPTTDRPFLLAQTKAIQKSKRIKSNKQVWANLVFFSKVDKTFGSTTNVNGFIERRKLTSSCRDLRKLMETLKCQLLVPIAFEYI